MADILAFALSPHFTGGAAVSALCGGMVLGASSVFKLWATGDVLGISGSTRGLLLKPSPEKVAFILGLFIGGQAVSRTFENAFEPLPPVGIANSPREAGYFLRLAVGGFMMGVGTSLANGCTSGHGLTGLARLTPRSWLGVHVFMGFGFVTATFTGSLRYLAPDAALEASLADEFAAPLSWFAVLLSILALATVLVLVASRKLSDASKPRLKPFVELICGFTFGCGLGVSGMARSSKVAAFLDLGSGAWDPSLALVLGGGIMITFPGIQYLERRGPKAPLLGGRFLLCPRSMPPDASLTLGTALFGTGWALCGSCPGPIWVNVGASRSPEVLVMLGGLMLGMAAWVAWHKATEAAKRRSQAASGTEKLALSKEADVAAGQVFSECMSTIVSIHNSPRGNVASKTGPPCDQEFITDRNGDVHVDKV